MMPGEMAVLGMCVLGMRVMGMRGMDTRGMGIGWDLPWMLLWLPAVILPFIIARMLVAKPRTVRWAAIDIVARAARRAGLSKSGVSLPLVLLRALVLLLAIVGAARPLIDRRDSADGGSVRGVEQVVAGTSPRRRIILVEPAVGPTPADPATAPPASALRLAIKALCESGGFRRAEDSPDEGIPAVDVVSPQSLAAVLSGGSGEPPAAAGTLVIGTDGSLPFDFESADGAGAGIARAVDRGAALLVLIGPQTVGGPAQRRLSDWLGTLAGITIAGRADGAGQRIAIDPTLADFVTEASETASFSTLPGPSVTAFAELALPPPDGSFATTVLARTVPDGRPLLVEARVGGGRICVSALPLALGEPEAWSDLTVWPAFVPMVDRLATRLLDAEPGGDRDPQSRNFVRRTAAAATPVQFLRDQLPPARLLLAAALLLALAEPFLSWRLASRQAHATAVPERPLLQWLARTVILATLVALFVGAGPKEHHTGDDKGRRRPALLIDVSPSMATADAGPPADPSGAVSRLQAVRQAITAAAGSNWEVSYFTVARELTPIAAADLRTAAAIETIPVAPRASRLGDAVEEIIAAGGDRWSAIAVASDGMITAGATWEHAGRFARGRGIPLIAIPVGGRGADATSDDAFPRVTITEARLPRIIWRGEEVAVRVEAEAPSKPDRVPVTLTARDGRRLAEGVLHPQPDIAMPARFVGEIRWQPAESGPQTLVVQAGSAEAESGADALAGAIVTATRVVDEPVPVLLIDASPRFEFRFLEHLLATDRRFRVESCLLDARGRSLAVAPKSTPPARLNAPLPATAAEWSRFDAVVLGDVCGADLANDSITGLLTAVREDGLGVAWIPGRRWSGRGATATGGLGELLPATPAADDTVRADGAALLRWLPAGWQSGWVPVGVLSAAGSATPEVSMLAGGVRLRPTARVLAVAEPSGAPARPAIVLDQYGAGSVLGQFFASWRLRGTPAAAAPVSSQVAGSGGYAVYWRHALVRLAEGRMLARHAPATIDIRPLRPVAGDVSRIDIASTRPKADRAGWQLKLTRPDGRGEALAALRTTIGIDDLEPGWHTLTLIVPVAPESPSSPQTETVWREFFVVPPVDERPGPPATADAMQAAAIASGGAVVPLAAVASLPARIRLLAAGRADTPSARPFSPSTMHLLMLALLAACVFEWSQRAGQGMP